MPTNKYNKERNQFITLLNIQDRIESLEEIGSEWKFNVFEPKILEQRCRDLEAFKSEFGHCKCSYADPLCGLWSIAKRHSYKQTQQEIDQEPDRAFGRKWCPFGQRSDSPTNKRLELIMYYLYTFSYLN